MKARITIKNFTNSGRRVGWTKHVTAVDTSKTNGYALEGDFLKDGLHELPVGAIIVQQAPTGSVANGGKDGYVYKVTAVGTLEPLLEETDWTKSFLSIRDAVVAGLNQKPTFDFTSATDKELLAECARRNLLL